jgi:hypothetical protein
VWLMACRPCPVQTALVEVSHVAASDYVEIIDGWTLAWSALVPVSYNYEGSPSGDSSSAVPADLLCAEANDRGIACLELNPCLLSGDADVAVWNTPTCATCLDGLPVHIAIANAVVEHGSKATVDCHVRLLAA